jgi:SAM-dependent methyltransferase
MAGDFFFDMPNVQGAPISAEVLQGYRYDELNRDSGAIWEAFSPIDQKGPHGTLVDLCERADQPNGFVTVLDAGCGTGNQLRTFMEQAADLGLDTSKILADGVSDHDFSFLGQVETRAAIDTGKINYQLLDLAKEPLPPAAYDLIYSYDVLVHNREPAGIIDNFWQALRPGGVAYFNLAGKQLTNKVNFLLREFDEHDGEVWCIKSKPSPFTALRYQRDQHLRPLPERYAVKLAKTQ